MDSNAPLETLQLQFAQLRAAYERDRMPTASARRASLTQLERLLRENQAALAKAISADFSHRPIQETTMLELFPAISTIKDARSHVGSWMRSKRRWASLWFLPARTELRPQPLGVVGIIVPWNYPILLAIAPLAAALAAGNRVLVKMSEFTPQTGALFASLVAKYFAPDQVAVVNGGVETAQAFSALPFDHLLFTGSTAVGRQVMRAAAENLTPVTLELGGKSPAIVGPECRIEEAAEKIMFGKCLNAGQTCIAPDYVLVPNGRELDFIAAARRTVDTLYPEISDNIDYTAIVNARHLQRLQGYLLDAQNHGAALYPLTDDIRAPRNSQKMLPVAVLGAAPGARVLEDEIFGPILPVLGYSNLDAAIAYVNARPRPLALYYFGNYGDHTEQVLNQTVAGGVTINETLLHISQEHLPFGGVGPSGMGAYHGKVGFDTFSKLKPIFRQSMLNGVFLLKPPYGRRFANMIKMMLR